MNKKAKRNGKGQFIKGGSPMCSPFVKGHKVRIGMKHTDEFKKRRSGAGNPNWKGDSVKYSGLHSWIRKHLSNDLKFCEECKSTEKKLYEWANIDHKYKRERRFWKRMCRGCHMKYDYKMGFRKPTIHTEETKRKISNKLKKNVT